MVAAALCFALPAQSQTFEAKTLPLNEEVYGKASWADFDNDGDLDLFLINASPFYRLNKCYRNDGSVFTPVHQYAHGDFQDWGDFNQDGRLDLLSTGNIQDGFRPTTGIISNLFPFNGCDFSYRNGDLTILRGIWSPNTGGYLATYQASGGVWGDDDQDGDTDVLLCSQDSTDFFQTRIFHWNGQSYQVAHTLPIPEVISSDITWEDFDLDGDVDILLRDRRTHLGNGGYLFEQRNGNYQPLVLPASNFQKVESLCWVDLDNDGDLDIARTGTVTQGYETRSDQPSGLEILLYENGIYRLDYAYIWPDTDAFQYGFCRTGDLDNDGYPEVIVNATKFNDQSRNPIHLYHYVKDGPFQPAGSISNPLFRQGQVVDYDRDGDLDFSEGKQILENISLSHNTPPTIPLKLTAAVEGKNVRFNWNAATDDHTPSAGLTYNIHVFTNVKDVSYLNGMSYLPTGARSVLKRGNAGARTQKQLLDLPDGTYYWTVQAIDQSLAASAYAPLQSFTIFNHGLSAAILLVGNQPLNTCECSGLGIGIKPTGSFGMNNRFLMQLSDSTGSFLQPTTLYHSWDDYNEKVYSVDYPDQRNSLATGRIPNTILPGTHYRIRIVSTNPVRMSAENGYDIAIKKFPQVPVISPPEKELCYNPTNTFLNLGTASQYANKYEWSLSPQEAGIITVRGAVAEVNWSDTYSGKVEISVRGVNGCGNGPISFPVELFIHPAIAPAGAIQGLNQLCPGQQQVSFAIEPVLNADAYLWTLPTGATVVAGSSSNSNQITLNFSDDFKMGQLKVAGINACGSGEPYCLLVESPGKVAPADRITGPDSLCVGVEVLATFSISSIAHAIRYVWKLSDESQSIGEYTTNESRLSLRLPNRPFTGKVVVQGINECQEGPLSPPFVFSVAAPPLPPVNIQGARPVCAGKSIHDYQVSPVAGARNYRWVLPTGLKPVNSSNTTRESHITLEVSDSFKGGDIQVRAINQCGESALSQPFTVPVFPALLPVAITQYCNTLQIPLATYPLQWYFEEVPLLGATQRELVVEQKGKYTLKVWGPCDTLTSVAEVEPITPTIHDIPNVFTPNGDKANPTFQLADKLLGSQLFIYNRWGQEVYRSESYQNDWDGNGQSVGVYYYYLTHACLPQPITGIISLLK